MSTATTATSAIDGNRNSSSRRTTSSTASNCQLPEITPDHFQATSQRPVRPRTVTQRARITEFEPEPELDCAGPSSRAEEAQDPYWDPKARRPLYVGIFPLWVVEALAVITATTGVCMPKTMTIRADEQWTDTGFSRPRDSNHFLLVLAEGSWTFRPGGSEWTVGPKGGNKASDYARVDAQEELPLPRPRRRQGRPDRQVGQERRDLCRRRALHRSRPAERSPQRQDAVSRHQR
ncbi:hypothetical protein SO3561_08007 [Streptomyces olivochromogenes]|uniref:Uncharacterized protein n=1 Tax=Streptomyces olivochromogenes TaxID=1963 RepID=A0A250VR37_STROL|nr:hypothetical protein SO3561_08007 [Streptomyces olivochromogenes]